MEKRFNPGAYRFKIDFLTPPLGQDDYGDPLTEWTIFKPGIHASKEPLLGNEFFTALTTDTNVEVKFNTRYIKGVTNKMRIKHGLEVYEILSAIDVKSEHKELLCYCKQVN
jgi:SPP1 family predicted phage head-tail adaptor